MLYRPNFCCQCGEKIARARWTPLTSRRFCDFCEIEQKQHDLIPRAAIVIATLFGAAGLTAYFGRSGEPEASSVKPTAQVRELRSTVPDKPGTVGPSSNQTGISQAASDPSAASSNAAAANIKQRDVRQNSSTEPVYYCGALTKKGTPCTRRVKTKVRCWQHAGQAAVDEVR